MSRTAIRWTVATVLVWALGFPRPGFAYQAEGRFLFNFAYDTAAQNWFPLHGEAQFRETDAPFAAGVMLTFEFILPDQGHMGILVLSIDQNAAPVGTVLDVRRGAVVVEYSEVDRAGAVTGRATALTGSVVIADSIIAESGIGFYVQFDLWITLTDPSEGGLVVRALTEGEAVTQPTPEELRGGVLTPGGGGVGGGGGGVGVAVDPYVSSDCTSDPTDPEYDDYAGVDADYETDTGCGGDDGSGESGDCSDDGGDDYAADSGGCDGGDSGDYTESSDSGCDGGDDLAETDDGCSLAGRPARARPPRGAWRIAPFGALLALLVTLRLVTRRRERDRSVKRSG